ncbi:MAG: ATP-binding protein, partial [Actinomycetota bacterium]|nr:ATP-binding protein [Actinomycetota bacterium]
VLGRAASDLVHLLAEILDNATLFSPRDSQVTLSSGVLADGSVAIEVNDRGVGMGEAELIEANERLATSPRVDASVSRRMGLFVVGRLASRHNIRVTLRRGQDNVGLTAMITLPPRLVRPVESVADSPPDSALVPHVRKSAEDGPAHRDVRIATGVNGSGVSARLDGDRGGAKGLEPSEDQAPPLPLGTTSQSELPQRGPAHPVPEKPSPPASRPPAVAPTGLPDVTTPNATTERSSGWDLFRSPVSPASEPDPLGLDWVAPRTSLEDATPIFDDIASAWFRESKPMAPPRSSAQPGMERPPGSQAPEEREVASSVPDRSESATEVPQGSAGPTADDWGLADAGWQAAEALTHPVEGEITPAGLPRRQPQAQLVPGAADSAASADPTAPVRSAEAVRGRLASYQRGVREGRQTRGHDGGGDEQGQQHDADEETQ